MVSENHLPFTSMNITVSEPSELPATKTVPNCTAAHATQFTETKRLSKT